MLPEYNRRLCAKRRLGHACICPRIVHSHTVLKLYPPPLKSWLFRGQEVANFGRNWLSLEQKNQAKTAWLSWLFCFSLRYRLSRTTSDLTRLFRPRPIDCDIADTTVRFSGFFRGRGKRHNKCFIVPAICDNLHPKRSQYSHSLIFVTGRSFFARQKWPANFIV